MELLDYLKWRNDVSLSVASFNDIDNVILSYISYMNFSELFPENNNTSGIEEIMEVFCEKYSLDEIRENGQFTARAPLLLEQMVKGERFKGTRIGHYKDIFDEEEIKQFSAVTFFLPDGTNYIAFRGTDSTITGWKEDFMMTYSPVIPAHKVPRNIWSNRRSCSMGKSSCQDIQKEEI